MTAGSWQSVWRPTLLQLSWRDAVKRICQTQPRQATCLLRRTLRACWSSSHRRRAECGVVLPPHYTEEGQ